MRVRIVTAKQAVLWLAGGRYRYRYWYRWVVVAAVVVVVDCAEAQGRWVRVFIMTQHFPLLHILIHSNDSEHILGAA